MNWKVSSTDLVKMLAGILGVVLAWQTQRIIGQIDALDLTVRRLECNQARILARLEIPPCASDTLDFGVSRPVLAPDQEIKFFKISSFAPGQAEGNMVGYKRLLGVD